MQEDSSWNASYREFMTSMESGQRMIWKRWLVFGDLRGGHLLPANFDNMVQKCDKPNQTNSVFLKTAQIKPLQFFFFFLSQSKSFGMPQLNYVDDNQTTIPK